MASSSVREIPRQEWYKSGKMEGTQPLLHGDSFERSYGAALLLGPRSVPWNGRWWRLRTVTAHLLAVRLCAVVYFFAFLGNVIDGPLMWKLSEPDGGWTTADRLFYCKVGMSFATIAVVVPRLWPALAICWPCWHYAHTDGGPWFGFGWDPMLDDVGFLTVLLAITLTLYDDLVEETAHDILFVNGQCSEKNLLAGGTGAAASQTADRLADYAGGDLKKTDRKWINCNPSVAWGILAAELALTFSAFRLFSIAGILKMKEGSDCWRDHTCLYTHFYTQPMPNPLAWFFHNWTTDGMKRFMQWFAIDVGECVAPYLLFGFIISTGPIGYLHRRLRRDEKWWWSVAFPARLLGAVLMFALLAGMWISGNYAFLHPISAVCLIAVMGTARCVPVMHQSTAPAIALYRLAMPWVVIALAIFAVLPGCNTVQWLLSAQREVIGESWSTRFQPVSSWLNRKSFVLQARSLNLGMDHYRYAYFAGAVESREENVFTAQVGGKWVEFDVPCKVGSVNRAPCVTSPLHRRFAWQLWYPFGDRMFDFPRFFEMLCNKDVTAMAALEFGEIAQQNFTAVGRQAFSYHFTRSGQDGWWTRQALQDREVHQCKQPSHAS